MPNIGGFVVNQWNGRLHYARPDIDIVERQGLDGRGVIYDAWRAEVQEITTRTITTAGSLGSVEYGYRKTMGLTLTVYDSFEIRWDNCIIIDCDVTHDQMIGGLYLITAVWRILPEAVRPA